MVEVSIDRFLSLLLLSLYVVCCSLVRKHIFFHPQDKSVPGGCKEGSSDITDLCKNKKITCIKTQNNILLVYQYPIR